MEIKVRVRAGARREKLKIVSQKEFKISVREEAHGNAANRRVVELVALHFGAPTSRVRILRGHRSITKHLSVG